MKTNNFSVLLAVLSLSGCTTVLTHERLKVNAQPHEPGFSYYLPRQQFAVTAIYELKDCTPEQEGPLEISQAISIVETSVADPAELYSIPLKTLTSAWKTTSLTGTVYENQTLHSIGATIDDRSGAIVKSAVGTAISVAKMAFGLPPAFWPQKICKPEIYKALDTVREGKTKLLDSNLDEKQRAAWAAAMVSAKNLLQITETYFFLPTTENIELTSKLGLSKLKAWFTNPESIKPDSIESSAENWEKYTRTLTTSIFIHGRPPTPGAVPKDLEGKGIIYREPAPIEVEVCAGRCGAEKSEILATLKTQAAQFGRYAVIPLENKPFQKNNLALSFAPNGRLESFTYSTESQLEKIATAIYESSSSVESFVAKKKTADEAAEAAAAGGELKSLKGETELLKAKADKIEAEARLLNLTIGK